jgi:starch synthase
VLRLRRGPTIRILLAASEVIGFAKTGGLADVVGALPRALARRGHECAIIMPMYRCARAAVPAEPTAHSFRITIGGQNVNGRLWRATLPGTDIPVYLVEQPGYFERDDPGQGKGLYQFTDANGQRRDYPDNCARFVFLCRSVLETIRLLGFWPDVLHVNDWQTGLVPVYLRETYGKQGDWAMRERFQRIKTLFTIHNIAYQGHFWHWDMHQTGLDWKLFNHRQLEFHGHLNFLKAGLVYADYLNTVSPTYAREIQTPYYGCGLQGVLTERRDRLTGIVNGVDYAVWDSATDAYLPARYSVDDLSGKAVCKEALQRRLGLNVEPSTPLLGVVARMVEQKGIDLICKAATSFVGEGAQLVALGEGDPKYQGWLQELRGRFPGQLGLVIGFDEGLAHQIEAGADAFLMPSLYEPSGLNQLYSLRYGTPPIVRSTGGLADTVTDASPSNLDAGTATGFSFAAYSADALLDTVRRATALYRSRPEPWGQLQRTGMRQDWSWDRSASEYERLYHQLVRSV